MNPLRSVKQTAELWSISPWTVRSYMKQGKLRPIRIGRRVLFEERELERFIRESATGGSGSSERRSDELGNREGDRNA
jgi:excisionase family DNA binding protein